MIEHYVFDPDSIVPFCEICGVIEDELKQPCPGLTPEQEAAKARYMTAYAAELAELEGK
jgi:hypothetical protein